MEIRVKGAFAAVFKCRLDDIGSGFSKDSVEAWDSLKHMMLITALEQEFGVFFEPDELIAVDSYSAALRVLKLKGV